MREYIGYAGHPKPIASAALATEKEERNQLANLFRRDDLRFV